jgi:hypothetical protein
MSARKAAEALNARDQAIATNFFWRRTLGEAQAAALAAPFEVCGRWRALPSCRPGPGWPGHLDDRVRQPSDPAGFAPNERCSAHDRVGAPRDVRGATPR